LDTVLVGALARALWEWNTVSPIVDYLARLDRELREFQGLNLGVLLEMGLDAKEAFEWGWGAEDVLRTLDICWQCGKGVAEDSGLCGKCLED
jgi:hypothetical protein